MTDVFNANKLVRDAGEVTNSMFILKAGLVLTAICIAISKYPRHYVSGDGTGDWRGLFQHVSTLVMAVKDKSGDIAVLRTWGRKMV